MYIDYGSTIRGVKPFYLKSNFSALKQGYVIISEMEGEIRFSAKTQNQVSMKDYWKKCNLTTYKRPMETNRKRLFSVNIRVAEQILEVSRTP